MASETSLISAAVGRADGSADQASASALISLTSALVGSGSLKQETCLTPGIFTNANTYTEEGRGCVIRQAVCCHTDAVAALLSA